MPSDDYMDRDERDDIMDMDDELDLVDEADGEDRDAGQEADGEDRDAGQEADGEDRDAGQEADGEDRDAGQEADGEDGDTVTFASLGLPEEILQAVTDMGFRVPTPIQAAAIPPLLELRDVVGIAQTGTGKTAAFGLPLLAIVDADERDVQALVLAPTRELAMQSAQAIEDFAARTARLDVVPVYGGSPYGPQIGALKRGAQVVVGTPGRVIDLIEKGALDLSNVRMLVLDEADEMLRMGFAEDVETIASSVPDDRLTALFSATMPAAIEKVAREHLKDPVKVAVSTESLNGRHDSPDLRGRALQAQDRRAVARPGHAGPAHRGGSGGGRRGHRLRAHPRGCRRGVP